MEFVRIAAGPFLFDAKLEHAISPKTCAEFIKLMPFRNRLIHVRWSGEACWVPLGDLRVRVGNEQPTSYPAPGQIILYPGGVSETKILLAYGAVRFASKAGQLAGNHFLTIIEGIESLFELGRMVLNEGAQDLEFEAAR